MSDLQKATFEGSLSLRDLDERLIEGRLVPFDEQIKIGGHEERFDPGAMNARPMVKFLHEHGEVIGKMVDQETRSEGEYATFKVSNTRTGDDVLELARDGVLGLSVGFVPVESRSDGRAKVHTKVDLVEVSAVGFPAFEGSQITSVRSKEIEVADEVKETPEVVETRAVEFDPEAYKAELEERLETRMREYVAQPPAVLEGKQEFSGRDVLIGALTKAITKEPLENRALDDVIGDLGAADASGVLYDEFWAGGLVGFTDSLRPLFSNSGAAPFPSGGYGLVTPRRTQTTVVGEHTPEKSEVPSQAYQADQQTFEMKWFAGAVDISMQLIEQSNPAIMGLVVDDLLSQYARATEADMVAQTESAATSVGNVVPVIDYEGFIAGVIATGELIRAATGVPGNWLGLITVDWIALLGLVDGDNRRILSTTNPRNADGSADFFSQSFNVGGVNVFHSFDSVASVQYNFNSLRKAERAPMRVEQNNVALMGRDVGVLGATIVVPLDPAGIYKYTV